jgi:Mn-dependent DtxR family transcriptional regulator
MDREGLKKQVFELVAHSHKKMKPSDLARTLARSLDVDKKEVKEAIAELTYDGKLIYSYAGHSWLEVPADSE